MAKILVVEDNEINRDMLSYRLNRKGYEVIIAVDGAEAVFLAGTENPALILMDLSLPTINGWEATRQIKADADTQHIPVIALTAHAMSGDRQKALEAGCDDYESKPIDFPRLLSKMKAQLARVLTSPSPPITSQIDADENKTEPIWIEAPLLPMSEATKVSSSNLVEAPQAFNQNQHIEKVTVFPYQEKVKLLHLPKPIKILYAFTQRGSWNTGSIVNLSAKIAEIHSNKRRQRPMPLHSEIRIRFWHQNMRKIGGDVSATFLGISEADNDRFFVEFRSPFLHIGEILHNLTSS